ncbi:MAG: MBL fold metallo-hydrolase [Bacilli bacterium]
MFSLNQVGDVTYYIDNPSKIGVVKLSDGSVLLIDTGSDKDTGRKIRQLMDSLGLKVSIILNTHSNADHIGGNKYLQNNTGCKIYGSGIENDFTNHPLLEPSFLYGGYPPKDLLHKFLLADASISEEINQINLPKEISIIDLPGHYFNMIGFRTSDDIVFLADALSSEETLEKYQIGFIYDVEKYLKTLEMIKTLKAKLFVPSHASVTDNIVPIAQKNIDKVYEISNKILKICHENIIFENILEKLFIDYKLTMDFPQYVLVGSTIRSYLAWLKDNGKLEVNFINGFMYWKTIF